VSKGRRNRIPSVEAGNHGVILLANAVRVLARIRLLFLFTGTTATKEKEFTSLITFLPA